MKGPPYTPRPEDVEVLDDEMVRLYRSKTGAERLAIAGAMFRSARKMLLAHLRAEHPDWSYERVQREAARRLSHGDV
ncbi:MAG: hypothetical protein ACOC5M_03190 [Chloroflexota bacterium]